jgi:hypothetical protein
LYSSDHSDQGRFGANKAQADRRNLDRRNSCLAALFASFSERPEIARWRGHLKIASAKKKTAIFRPALHCSAVVKILVDASTLIEKD